MKSKFIKRVSMLLLIMAASVNLSGCAENSVMAMPVLEDYDLPAMAEERKNLKIGIVAGPYGDMYLKTIQPLLETKGYTAEVVSFGDFISPNMALANKEIDLNFSQHYRFLNSFKFEYDVALSAITEIPTISMGVYSYKYLSFEDLPYGASVTIPSDSTNLARALIVLESGGFITIAPSVEKSKATEQDIIKNPKGLRFVPIEAQNLVQSLDGYDISVINGNYAFAGGLDPKSALYNELLDENYFMVIAVRTEDLGRQFVRDIIAAVKSESYKSAISNPDGKYAGFQRPRGF